MQNILEELRTLLETNLTTAFNKYYCGYVSKPPMAYLPVLCVYAIKTEQTRMSTNTDKWEFTIGIKIYTSAFEKIDAVEDVETGKILEAQKQIVQLMEQRDSGGVATTGSVLGVLRRNIQGTNYQYTIEDLIEYNQENIAGTMYYSGTMTLRAVSNFTSRS